MLRPLLASRRRMSKAEVACLIGHLIVVASRFAGAGRVARPPVHIAHARSKTTVNSTRPLSTRARRTGWKRKRTLFLPVSELRETLPAQRYHSFEYRALCGPIFLDCHGALFGPALPARLQRLDFPVRKCGPL